MIIIIYILYTYTHIIKICEPILGSTPSDFLPRYLKSFNIAVCKGCNSQVPWDGCVPEIQTTTNLLRKRRQASGILDVVNSEKLKNLEFYPKSTQDCLSQGTPLRGPSKCSINPLFLAGAGLFSSLTNDFICQSQENAICLHPILSILEPLLLAVFEHFGKCEESAGFCRCGQNVGEVWKFGHITTDSTHIKSAQLHHFLSQSGLTRAATARNPERGSQDAGEMKP